MKCITMVFVWAFAIAVFADTYRCEVNRPDPIATTGDIRYTEKIFDQRITLAPNQEVTFFQASSTYSFRLVEKVFAPGSVEEGRLRLNQGANPDAGTPLPVQMYQAESYLRTFIAQIDHLSGYSTECYHSSHPKF